MTRPLDWSDASDRERGLAKAWADAEDQLAEAKERIKKLEEAILNFAKEQAWASDGWKAQPHIAALFAIANKGPT